MQQLAAFRSEQLARFTQLVNETAHTSSSVLYCQVRRERQNNMY